MHDMLGMKDHAQAAVQGELLKTEQRGAPGESGDAGERLSFPFRADVPKPDFCVMSPSGSASMEAPRAARRAPTLRASR